MNTATKENIDNEILTIFKNDYQRRLEIIVRIASDPAQYSDIDKIKIIFHELHVMKGDAGLMGFEGAFTVIMDLREKLRGIIDSSSPLTEDQASIVVTLMNAVVEEVQMNGLFKLDSVNKKFLNLLRDFSEDAVK